MAEKIQLVTLENLEPRLACYNLDHNHTLSRSFPRVAKLENGQEHGHIVNVDLPDSVTFLARETKTLPASVLECDEIRSALAPREHGAKPRLRQRGDVTESETTAEESEPQTGAPDVPEEIVNTPARKAREASRSVLGTKANLEGTQADK